MITLWLLLIICLLFSAFFSCAETAITAVNHFRLKHRSLQNYRPAVVLEQLLGNIHQLITLILLGNNFFNISAASLATLIAIEMGGEGYVPIASGFLTFFILIFAEVLPKTFAASHPEFVAYRVIGILKYLLWFLSLLIKLILFLSAFWSKFLGLNTQNTKDNFLHLEELQSMLSANLIKAGDQYQHMLKGIVNLHHTKISSIMRYKTDVIGVDINQTWPEIQHAIIHNKPHSMIIVYKKDINHIQGVVHVKTLAVALLSSPAFGLSQLQQLIEPPLFTSMQVNLYQLLLTFQTKCKRMAIVLDEYGEFTGLVTLSDLFQQIIGEIIEEEQDLWSQIHAQKDGSYIIDGALSLPIFLKALKITHQPITIPAHIQTVNGLVLEHLENMPKRNTTFNHLGLEWKILNIDHYQIKSIQVRKIKH